jgi:hypothetical protein
MRKKSKREELFLATYQYPLATIFADVSSTNDLRTRLIAYVEELGKSIAYDMFFPRMHNVNIDTSNPSY